MKTDLVIKSVILTPIIKDLIIKGSIINTKDKKIIPENEISIKIKCQNCDTKINENYIN